MTKKLLVALFVLLVLFFDGRIGQNPNKWNGREHKDVTPTVVKKEDAFQSHFSVVLVIAVIVISATCGVMVIRMKKSIRQITEEAEEERLKSNRCPFCQSVIPPQATRCQYCKSQI